MFSTLWADVANHAKPGFGILKIESEVAPLLNLIPGQFHWKVYNLKTSRLIDYSKEALPRFHLAEGHYRIGFKCGEFEVSKTQQMNKARISMPFLPELGLLALKDVPLDLSAYQLPQSLTIEGGVPFHQWNIQELFASSSITCLKPGDYTLKLDQNVIEQLSVRANNTVETSVLSTFGALELSAHEIPQGVSVTDDMEYQIFQLGASQATLVYDTRLPKAKVLLPAGDYEIQASLGFNRMGKTITIRPGKVGYVNFGFRVGRLALKASYFNNFKAIEKNVIWEVRGMDGTLITKTARPTPDILLPVGEYKLTLKHGFLKHEESVSIYPGTRYTKSIRMKGAQISFSLGRGQEMISKNMHWSLYKNSAKKENMLHHSHKQSPNYYLPEGKYFMKVEYQSKTLLKQFHVKYGQQNHIHLMLNK